MKKFFTSVLVICMLVVMVGCTSSQTLIYNVDNGDTIHIKLNSTDGYSMSAKTPFSVYKDGDVQSQGTFINGSDYDVYFNVASRDGDVLDKGSAGGVEYIFWHYDAGEWQEYNYAIRVIDSNTAILLANAISEESAKDVFNRLTISVG